MTTFQNLPIEQLRFWDNHQIVCVYIQHRGLHRLSNQISNVRLAFTKMQDGLILAEDCGFNMMDSLYIWLVYVPIELSIIYRSSITYPASFSSQSVTMKAIAVTNYGAIEELKGIEAFKPENPQGHDLLIK